MKRYHHTPNSNDVRMPLDGAQLFNVEPMGEEFYDKDETGPMFTAEAEGFDGVLHLFADEIVDDDTDLPHKPLTTLDAYQAIDEVVTTYQHGGTSAERAMSNIAAIIADHESGTEV